MRRQISHGSPSRSGPAFVRFAVASLALGTAFGLSACSGDSGSPTEPTGAAAGTTTAGVDGTTLKATAPSAISPKDRVTVDSLNPTLSINVGKSKFVETGLAHKFELYEENTLVATYTIGGTANNTQNYTVPDTLKYGTLYRWRARAEQNGAFGPWSATADFLTMSPPAASGGGGGGSGVSAQRRISVNEAWDIIIRVHNELRYNLGSGSTREQRVAFLWAAVGVVHYGHPRFNPAGGDPDWCVKDAGGGRPPSDDVLVSCSSRDAWDLIGGAGANGYSFHLDYLGRLDGGQNVYPPPVSSLPR